MEECRREVEEEQDEMRLVCREGLEVYTHKAVLGLISPLLRSILASCPTSYPTLLLPDYRKDQVLLLLKVLAGEWHEGTRVSRGVVELLQDLGISLQGEQEVEDVEEQEEEEQEKEVEGGKTSEEHACIDKQETAINATAVREKSRNPTPIEVMKSNQESQGSVKNKKRTVDQFVLPVKRVKIMLKNITKTFPEKLTPENISDKIPLEQSKGAEIVAQNQAKELKEDSNVNCVVCGMNFRDQAKLCKHYCHKHFYAELGSLVPQYMEGNTCKVCGLQFLNQNSINLRSHIGIDHEVLNKLLGELELNDLGNDTEDFRFSDDESTSKQDEDITRSDDPPAMSIEDIQKMLLPYQDDLEEAVSKETISGKTSLNEMVEEDDEIIEVAVPPKPEAPLIDLELEEDDDSKLLSMIEDTLEDLQQSIDDISKVSDEDKTNFDNGSEIDLVGGLADICEVLFK